MNTAIHKSFTPITVLSFALITLGTLFGGWWLDNPLLFAVPFGVAIAYVAVLDFSKIYYLLIAMLPLSAEITLPGGFGTNLPSEPLMIGLMLVWFFYSLSTINKKVDRPFLDHPIIVWLLLHIIWIGIATIFASIPIYSIKFFLAKIWYLAAFVFMTRIIVQKFEDQKILFWCLFIPLTFVCLQTLLRHAALGFSFEDVNKTMGPFFRNHVDYAVMLVVFFPFLIAARKWYRSGGLIKAIIDLGIIAFVAGIFFSYTRTAMGALLLIPIGYYMFKFRLTKLAVGAALSILIFFVASSAIDNNYLKFAPNFEKTIYHTDFEDHLTATLQGEDVSFMERVHRWVAAVRMSGDRWLTGFGPSNFYFHYKQYTVSDFETYVSDNPEKSTTHNYFLMVLAEQGIIGLFIFGGFCIAIFIIGERIYFQTPEGFERDYMMAVLLSLYIIMINLMMSDLIETDKIGSLFFINVTLLVIQDIRNTKTMKMAQKLNET